MDGEGAKRLIVFNRDTDFTTGHCECSECGRQVDQWDVFCRWCGVRFTGTERMKGQHGHA